MANNKKEINLIKLMSPEFLRIWKHICYINPVLRKNLNLSKKYKNISTFKVKSAKGVGKTYTDLLIIAILMIIDKNFSFIAVMDTKGENYKKIQRDFARVLSDLDKIIPGLHSLFDFYESESRLSIRYNNGEHIQHLDFASVEELGKGGWAPPENTYYGGYLWDETILKASANRSTFELEEMQIGFLRNWRLSARRYLKHYDVPSFICFENCNPFVGNSPVIEEHNIKVPDDLETQIVELWRDYEDYDNGIYYATAALEANPWHTLGDLEEVDSNILDWNTYLTEKYGMNSYGSETILGKYWDRVLKYQPAIPRREEFICFNIGIDVGSLGNSSAKTGMILIGFHLQENYFTALDEWFYDPKTQLILSPDQMAREMVMKLVEWEDKYYTFRNPVNKVPLEIWIDPTDSKHSALEGLLKQQHENIFSDPEMFMRYKARFPLTDNIVFQLATVKWDKKWTGIERNSQWELMIGSKMFRVFKEWSPQLYKELPNLRVKDGKRIDTDTDLIQATEYALNHLMRYYFNNEIQFDNKRIRQQISDFLKSRNLLKGGENE